MTKELKYWELQYKTLKDLYTKAFAKLQKDPTNPWQKTRVQNLEIEYLEANDRYFTMLEEANYK